MKILELRLGWMHLVSVGVYELPESVVYLVVVGKKSFSAKMLRRADL